MVIVNNTKYPNHMVVYQGWVSWSLKSNFIKLENKKYIAMCCSKNLFHKLTFFRRLLYWLNSDTKQLLSCNFIGQDIKVVAELSSYIGADHVFGLTVDLRSKHFVVSTLSSGLFHVSVESLRVQRAGLNLGPVLFGLTYGASPKGVCLTHLLFHCTLLSYFHLESLRLACL